MNSLKDISSQARIRPWIINLVLVLLSTLISFVVAEYIFRWAMFSGGPRFENLRQPKLYADRFSEDDFFKLKYLFTHRPSSNPEKPPHPLLGWKGKMLDENLRHQDAGHIGQRRPVLLYGDSFAAGVGDAESFQDILNRDEAFSRDYYLLNYGVSGFGVDQIYLMLQHSLPLYQRPIVIFSLMTLDLDRSILSFRGGAKPYFRVEDGALRLYGTPLTLPPGAYIAENPPEIVSYLYRKSLFSGMMPESLRACLRSKQQIVQMKKQLNRKILLAVLKLLDEQQVDYCFLIFHPHFPGISTLDRESDWRDPFLRTFLDSTRVPHIWSKDLYRRDAGNSPPPFDQYIVPTHGHPTTRFNRIIAAEILRRIREIDPGQGVP